MKRSKFIANVATSLRGSLTSSLRGRIYKEMTWKSICVLYEENFQGIYVNFTRIYFRVIYVCFTRKRETRFEVFTMKLSGVFTWKLTCSLRRKDFLRFYDEIISSLCYDELARKYALRQTFNDETGFFGNSS